MIFAQTETVNVPAWHQMLSDVNFTPREDKTIDFSDQPCCIDVLIEAPALVVNLKTAKSLGMRFL